MGSFYSQGKNEYFWRFLAYLQDENVYANDKQTIPYTPAQQLYYTALWPQFYVAFPQTTLYVYVNNKLLGQGLLNDPSGLLYVAIPVPQGQFVLEVKTAAGRVLSTEVFEAKNYAMFFDVAAQSYEDRRIAIEQVRQDQSYATIRSDRVYPVVGEFFGFPPPPGWTPQEYRDTILGDGGCKPGFTAAFFLGGTRLGVLQAIQSIVGCSQVDMLPADEGYQWVIYDLAEAPNPVTGGAEAWYISDVDIPLPEHRVVINDENYFVCTTIIRVHGSDRTVTDEQVYRVSNSFIESAYPEPYLPLPGKTLSFRVEDTEDPTTWMQFNTTFVAATTAAAAAAEILAQNPALGPAVYAQAGRLRVGVPPMAGVTRRVTILGGTALPIFGWIAGQDVDIANDYIANAYPTSPVVLTWSTSYYTEGIEFSVVQETGEVVWLPSSATLTTLPPAGSVMTAAYTFIPEREVLDIINKSKAISALVELEFVP